MNSLRVLLLTTSGRIGRWTFFTFVAGLSLIPALLATAASPLPWGRRIIVALVLLAAAYPAYCALVRRLHDIGLSARWVLVFLPDLLFALCLPPITQLLADPAWLVLNILIVTAFIIGRGFLLSLFFWPGQRVANPYGPARI